MLAKLPVILSIWFLLSLVVTLLVGRAISTFRKVPPPRFVPPLETETDWKAADVEELEEEELFVLAH